MSQKKPLSREAVLNKALELAEKDGIDSVGYNGLARELEIKPQSMYRYVSNLKDLRRALIEHELEELAAKISAAIAGLPPVEALRTYAIALYDACHENPLYYQALSLMHTYGLVEDMREPLSKIVSMVQDQFVQLEPDRAEAARHVQLFMAVNLGYAQMSMTSFFPESLHDDRDAFVTSIDEITGAIGS